MSSNELARLVGTTGATIRRLETGVMELTVSYMTRIAEALGVTPADLISVAAIAGFKDDVLAIEAQGPLAQALALKSMRFYRVISDAVSMSGVTLGSEIVVDQSESAIAAAKAGDIVLVQVDTRSGSLLALRVFVPPTLVVTNRHRSNAAVRLGVDADVKTRIAGVVVR